MLFVGPSRTAGAVALLSRLEIALVGEPLCSASLFSMRSGRSQDSRLPHRGGRNGGRRICAIGYTE